MNDFEASQQERNLTKKTVVRQFTLGDAKGHAWHFLEFLGTSILWQGRCLRFEPS